jgi:D-sedoheptulose 7-phosphate isomerase
MTWKDSLETFFSSLSEIEVTGQHGSEYSHDQGFSLLHEWVSQLRKRRNTMYFIGNGASASMASHYSADMAKNGHLHTQVFSDLSLITAISNDIGYEDVFSIPLERRAIKGDMLVAISSSGSSPNILKAVETALGIDLTVITLSAMSPYNPLRQMGSLNFYIPAGSYGHAETGHAAILHHLMDIVEKDSGNPTETKPS